MTVVGKFAMAHGASLKNAVTLVLINPHFVLIL